jgi:hypothetical protein
VRADDLQVTSSAMIEAPYSAFVVDAMDDLAETLPDAGIATSARRVC